MQLPKFQLVINSNCGRRHNDGLLTHLEHRSKISYSVARHHKPGINCLLTLATLPLDF